MQNPQSGNWPRHLVTGDRNALAEFHAGKARHYVQLAAGQVYGELLDARFGQVQICRERLNASMHVHAAPPIELVPFALPLSESGNVRFCGDAVTLNSLILAAGGEWEAHVDSRVDYVLWVFSRPAFEAGVEQLTGQAVASDWLQSRVHESDPVLLAQHRRWMLGLLGWAAGAPQALAAGPLCRAIEAETLRLTVRALTAGMPEQKRSPAPRRRQAVRKAIEFIRTFAADLPTIPQLCSVTGVSERTLEYAFREHCGVTPQQYSKLVRLNEAHSALIEADASQTRVTDVALQWGFLEHGRFAAEYARLFGEVPSATLKRPAAA